MNEPVKVGQRRRIKVNSATLNLDLIEGDEIIVLRDHVDRKPAHGYAPGEGAVCLHVPTGEETDIYKGWLTSSTELVSYPVEEVHKIAQELQKLYKELQ